MVCLALLLGVAFITVSNVLIARISTDTLEMERIQQCQKELVEENYTQVCKKLKLTGNQYIEIVDEAGHIIFTDRKTERTDYSLKQLALIADAFSDQYVYVDRIPGKGLNVFEKYDYENQNVESALEGIIIVDDNGKCVYTTMDMEEEENYIPDFKSKDVFDIGIQFMQKLAFQTNAGEKRYLLFHSSNMQASTYQKIVDVERIMMALYVALCITLILLFGFFMSYQMKRPLSVLAQAMLALAAGERKQPIQYSGSKEMVMIYDTFNDMARRLQESEEERKKLEAGRQKMLTDISHDLRTPITVIQGYSKAICDGIVTGERRDKYLNAIYLKSNILSELMDSFYEYSKLEHPEFTLKKEEGDFCEYVREYLAEKYQELEINGIGLEVDLPEDAVMLSFDHLQMKRVFENLISNSIKHNNGNTVLSISMKKDKKIILIFGDNGSGIPKELQDTIFEPFVVGDESRNTKQGTGLGMAICKKIIEEHGGEIKLLKTSLQGTQIQITL